MLRNTRSKHVVTAVRNFSSTNSLQRTPASRFTRLTEEPPRIIGRTPSANTRLQALPWVLASLLAGGIAFYGGALLVAARKPVTNPEVANISQQKDVSDRYEDTADSFDSEVGISESLMGINRIRKKLAARCKGDVLEVSCGTGRNIGYYDVSKEAEIDSITFVDISPHMVEVCKSKWDILVESQRRSDKLFGRKSFKSHLVVRFLTGSALASMPTPPSKKKYDTIFQTMGLCSTPSPKNLLLNMIKHLDTSNPDSRIILLEHGRSYRPWLNNVLDHAAEKHAEIHGCWFNRDIGELVNDVARKTGFEVVLERRHHFGTTWIFELKPSAELVRRSFLVEEAAESQEHLEPRSWLSWITWK